MVEKYLVGGRQVPLIFIHETQYERLPRALFTAAGLTWDRVKAYEWLGPAVHRAINGRTTH